MNRWLSGLALVAVVAGKSAMAFEPGKVECIAPAVPGGGWDLTCRSVGQLLAEQGLAPGAVTTTNMSGTGGSVAHGYVVGKRNDDPNLLIAASTATTQPSGTGSARRLVPPPWVLS